LVAASVLAEGVARPVTLNPPAARSEPKVPLVMVLDVRVEATPSRVTVPVASGKVIVLSAVGLVTVRVVSLVSAEDPSNTILESFRVRPVTIGLVIVLFVRVSLPVRVTKLSSDRAVLN
jgi:hypothetical protein